MDGSGRSCRPECSVGDVTREMSYSGVSVWRTRLKIRRPGCDTTREERRAKMGRVEQQKRLRWQVVALVFLGQMNRDDVAFGLVWARSDGRVSDNSSNVSTGEAFHFQPKSPFTLAIPLSTKTRGTYTRT